MTGNGPPPAVEPPAIDIVRLDAPDDQGAIPLETGPAPDHLSTGFPPVENWFSFGGRTMVRNVSGATLTPFLPDGDEASGAAVVIAAGGGYLIESMETEAWAQARWLAARGVAAFVLKYRLQPTPVDDSEFRTALIARFAAAAANAASMTPSDVPPFMIDDAAAAMRLVRERAAAWSVDPRRIGYLGFSAGAMIGLALAERDGKDAAPAFLAAIYPSMARRPVHADPPPLFAAMAADDQLYGRQGYGLIEGWRAAGGSVELHVYARGGHGFGMGTLGTTSTGLMPAFHAWLECDGWLGTGR